MSQDVILVGLDGSKPSVRALDWATQQAKVMAARLELVCAYGLPAYANAGLDGGLVAIENDSFRVGAEQVLARGLDRCQVARVEAEAHAIAGDALAVLVTQSEAADLLVVGTRGGGGFSERLLGTVSSALPAHSYCPTVVVPYLPPGTVATERGTETLAGPLDPIRTIVAGVDGSDESILALQAAVEQAKLWDAELRVVAAVPTGTAADLLAWLPAPTGEQDLVVDVEQALETIVAEQAADLTKPVLVMADEGRAPVVLAKLSATVDLLVLGSRGRSGFAGLLLGSTSQAVLHHSLCPVLIVTTRSGAPQASGRTV